MKLQYFKSYLIVNIKPFWMVVHLVSKKGNTGHKTKCLWKNKTKQKKTGLCINLLMFKKTKLNNPNF